MNSMHRFSFSLSVIFAPFLFKKISQLRLVFYYTVSAVIQLRFAPLDFFIQAFSPLGLYVFRRPDHERILSVDPIFYEKPQQFGAVFDYAISFAVFYIPVKTIFAVEYVKLRSFN